MADYSQMTQDDFDRYLAGILRAMTGEQLLAVPGVSEIVAEHFNNDVLDRWEVDHPLQAAGIEFKGVAPCCNPDCGLDRPLAISTRRGPFFEPGSVCPHCKHQFDPDLTI